jgi:LacI family transcriptional regulator/LacI family repressor for deo operon, udp, cdd, tsx, nupC, and nupG
VVGYDDIEAAAYMQLTTVRQSLFDSGVTGARLLLDMMKQSLSDPQKILLPTELVIRSSTAKPERILF